MSENEQLTFSFISHYNHRPPSGFRLLMSAPESGTWWDLYVNPMTKEIIFDNGEHEYLLEGELCSDVRRYTYQNALNTCQSDMYFEGVLITALKQITGRLYERETSI